MTLEQSDDRVVLIYNPQAGRSALAGGMPLLPHFPSALSPPLLPFRQGADWLQIVQRRLRRSLGQEAVAVAVESFDHASNVARQAASDGAALVLAAGGDGTLRAVAEGLAGTGTPFGILPRGTVNVLARELDIPLGSIEEALEIALHGRTQPLDLGRIGSRYFLLMCSVGFDALAVASVNPDLKGMVGSPAYVLAALGAVSTFVPPALRLRLDGGAVDISGQSFLIVAANTASYGGDLRIAPEASPFDGLLDLCVLEAPEGPPPIQTAAFLRQIGAIALGRAHHDPDIHYFRARHVEIEADTPVESQMDGDAYGSTPLVVDIAPGALNVRVP